MTREYCANLAVLTLIAAGVARAMIRIGIMDMPAGRKAHNRPTPKAGGIAPIAAFVASFAIFSTVWELPTIIVVTTAVLLGLVGLIDDLRDLGVGAKLAAQTMAALVVVCVGPGPATGWADPLPWLAVGWLVFITNAFNFMDGLNGLAAGAGLIAAVFLASTAPPGSAAQIGALALAAGLAGFLPFNFPRARLFLGDTGSQFCGFLLGVLGLGLARETGAASAIWLLPMLLAGMIVDVGVTLIRRFLAGACLTTAHREHFYQRAALHPSAIALVHCGFVVIGGLAWHVADRVSTWPALVLLALTHFAWLCFVESGTTDRNHPPRGVRNRP